MPTTRPNILLIMSDEHDPAVTGCYGDKVVRTPHLDRLAAEGIAFDACYTTSPLCVPARMSFTAMQYVSRCGVWSNNFPLPHADYPSLPRLLNAAGYESYLCGKMHYDKATSYGFTELIPEHNKGNKKLLGERRKADSTERNEKGWQDRIQNFFVGNEEESGVMKHDVECTEKALEFLAGRRAEDKPFFMTLGYVAPHFPLIAPQKYFDEVKGRVPPPNLPPDWIERLPANYRHLIGGFGIDNSDKDVVQRGRELYWALAGWLDHEIGKVLDALENSAAARNTIVIYTSDHGENKGDHGLWWKNNMYEHSARIPLIVRFPEHDHAGERRSGACSLLDLAQTIGELAGAKKPEQTDGDSLLEYIGDPQCGWKDQALCEYYGHNVASGYAMLRQGHWKYVYHTRMDDGGEPERELYHLGEDPGEWNNLAKKPEHRARVKAMHAALAKEAGRDPEEAEAECREDFAGRRAKAVEKVEEMKE